MGKSKKDLEQEEEIGMAKIGVMMDIARIITNDIKQQQNLITGNFIEDKPIQWRITGMKYILNQIEIYRRNPMKYYSEHFMDDDGYRQVVEDSKMNKLKKEIKKYLIKAKVFNKKGQEEIWYWINHILDIHKVTEFSTSNRIIAKADIRNLGDILRKLVYANYEEFGLDTNAKMKEYPKVVLTILSMIWKNRKV